MKAINKLLFTITLSFLSCVVFAQQSENILISPGGDTITVKPIPLLEISPKIGDFNTQLKVYKDKLKTYQEVYQIDTSVNKSRKYLADKKLQLVESIDKLSMVKIENAKREWNSYEKKLENWESIITKRITDLEATLFKIHVNKSIWELTKQSAKEQAIPEESVSRINDVIAVSAKLEKALKAKQDSIIIIQNKITDFKVMVDEVLSLLEDYRKNLQSEYFIQDSPPLWKAGDSTIRLKIARIQFINSFEGHTKSVELFVTNNNDNLVLHLIIFILTLILFYYLNIEFKKQELPENQKTRQLKYFLSRYFLSSLLVSLSFSIILYSNIPTIVRESLGLIMLIPVVVLYYRIIPKVMKPLLFYIVVLYIIDEVTIFFTAKTLLTRLQMLFQNFLYIYIMLKLVRTDNIFGEVYKGKWLKAINRIAHFFIIISVISILCNFLGYVNLSIIFSNTLVGALIVAISLSLLVRIISAMFASLFKTRFFQLSNIIKSYEDQLLRKLYSVLIYFAVFLWVRSIFISLGLAEVTGNWLLGLMRYEWKIGTVNISFGGIIAFFLVILITSVVTRAINYLLEDEIFPRIKLGRGVPGAISMVIRYSLVAFGIYIALSAAGFDFSKFGLIAGALGVGIGFGLQGVVYNFIAGLILAFERPIQKGDTIEIGTLFGDVINIGVRASTIRTYDGSEVIVPNSNLISNELINWTLSDRKRRREVKVGVAYGTDPHKVMELLYKVVSENENVLPYPKPWPLFEGFGESSLNFRILFWVNFDSGLTVQSEVAMNIYDALADAGIQIPFPQTDLHVKSFDPTIQKTIFPFVKDQSKKSSGRKPGRPGKKEEEA